MLNGTLFYSINTKLSLWDVWSQIRCYKKREEANPIKSKVEMIKGSNTFTPNCEFDVSFNDLSKLPSSLPCIFNSKMKYICLDQIDNDYRKCIYYQVSSSLLSYIISFCMRKATDYTVIFVRISNIEVKSNFDTIFNSKFDIRQGSNMSVDDMNDTNATLNSKESNSSNLSGNIKTTNNSTNNNNLSSNQTPKTSLKESNSKKLGNNKVDLKEVKDSEEEIISQNLSCKEKDTKLKLHETKIFSIVKDVLSFERDNMLKILKSITKKQSQEYSIQESKVFKINYKKLAYIISDLRKLIQIGNDNGGYVEESKETKVPVYTILEDKESSTKNSFTIQNNVFKYNVKVALEKFIFDEFHAEVSYYLEMDTITQRYNYLIKKIEENFCYVQLTLTLKGSNIEEIMSSYKLFKVKLVLLTLEKHIKSMK